MNGPASDKLFTGSIAKFYEEHLVPLIFAPYADDLARRVRVPSGARVLEVAVGTGVVTRRLASVLPPDVAIVATDLNQPMLDQAASIGTSRPVQWQQADAQHLPFEAGQFDAVVCQFGAMFFADKRQAYAEARRVLKPGGMLLFNVWDRIEDNEFADVTTRAMAALFPADPPRFLVRTPHGYSDTSAITRELRDAGFAGPVEIATLAARSRAASARIVALAYCQGTPLRNEIEARDASRLAEATEAATRALENAFGLGAVDGKIQAHIIAALR